MGAVHFSLDPRLARILTETLSADVLVETGTGEGDTVAGVRPFFSEIHTIEWDGEIHASAARRFCDDAAINVHHGDSPKVLARLVPGLASRGVLYWLDAHATGLMPVDAPECPLLEELAAISTLNDRSAVLIDDARLFLAPPLAPRRPEAWPNMTSVLACLDRLSASHETMVIDDVFVFAPASASGPLRDFAHREGFDWLLVVDKARAYENLLDDARAKEGVLRAQDETLRAQDETLRLREDLLRRQDADAKEKDALIQRLDHECRLSDERIAALEAQIAALQTAPTSGSSRFFRWLRGSGRQNRS